MEKTNMSSEYIKARRNRRRQLKRGKPKGLNPFEYLGSRISGGIDGKNGLPRESSQTDTQNWSSPFIAKQINSYKEFCGRSWAGLQLDNEPLFINLETRLSNVRNNQTLLEDAKLKLKEEKEKIDNASDKRRKTGEESLSEDQVKARRVREKAAALSSFYSEVSSLEKAIHDDAKEMFEIRNIIVESNNDVHMICEKAKSHTLQKIDVYWNAALKSHKEDASMPAFADITLEDDAETTYMNKHESLLLKSEDVLHKLDSVEQNNIEQEVA